ncbi:MAG TPA: matrixin family metalloprotease [Polyangia bacterium]|nr:matrixin family metalloprotease [Polyangia bacterium]
MTKSGQVWAGILGMAALVAVPACGDDGQGNVTGDPAVGEAGLGLGASGPAVEEAYRHLMAHGYFPNQDLAARFPSWKPVVPDLPARPDTIDAAMVRALRKLQANLGLDQTGTLNAATTAAMAEARCGVPDRDPARGESVDKWAVYPSQPFWTKKSITVRFTSPSGSLSGLSSSSTIGAIMTGIKRWEEITNLTFTQVSTGGDILIDYVSIDGVGKILAQGNPPAGSRIQFDTAESLSLGTLIALAEHEAGHTIGLDHSSLGNSFTGYPVMYPIIHDVIAFTDDDIGPANAAYNDFTKLPGLALDIGVGSVSGHDVAWVIGTNNVPYQWNGSGWTQVPGVTGSRIDVDNFGAPWVVGLDGRIFRYSGGWSEVAGGGRAKDIGCGSDGSVYVIGNDLQAWAYNFSARGWSFAGGPANQVSIDVTPSGQPCVLTSGHEVWVLASTWTRLLTGINYDIGLGGYRSVPFVYYPYFWFFTVAGGIGAPNNSVVLWGSQGAVTDGTGTAPAFTGFVPTQGLGVRISAGSHGRPWVVASDHTIWNRLEMPF